MDGEQEARNTTTKIWVDIPYVWAQTTPLVTWIIKGKPGNRLWSWEGQTGCLSSYIQKPLRADGVCGPTQRSCTIIDKDCTSGWRWTTVQLPIKTNESWCVTHLSWSSERMSKSWDIMVSSWLCKQFPWEINSRYPLLHRHNCIQLIQASSCHVWLIPHFTTDPNPKQHNPIDPEIWSQKPFSPTTHPCSRNMI